MKSQQTQTLVSLPAAAATNFRRIAPHHAGEVFTDSDPPGSQLGSGGGTAYLLTQAWKNGASRRAKPSFDKWLAKSQKLLIHGSGESRRLPGYAAIGKPMIPLPLLYGMSGQRPDQTLLDLQIQTYERLFIHAPTAYRVMVACGDVLLSFDHWLPVFPDADILILGMTASHEEAQRHGVMLCQSGEPSSLVSFVQKPSLDEIGKIEEKYVFYLDTGVWLFTERALAVLMGKCGWKSPRQAFAGGFPANYDLYGEFGLALGSDATRPDPRVTPLRAAVVPLPDARFYHFGTNASILASVAELQNPAAERRSFGHASMHGHAAPVIRNAHVRARLGGEHRHIWIENSHVPETWKLSERHVITGVPKNDWSISLEPGVCLDISPVRGKGFCVRAYGFDDGFRGQVGGKSTTWLDSPVAKWFSKRRISLGEAKLDPRTDIFDAKLFPVLKSIDPRFVAWLCSRKPDSNEEYRRLWIAAPRMSGRDLLGQTDLIRLSAQRNELARRNAAAATAATWLESCGRMDLAAAADLYVGNRWHIPKVAPSSGEACDLDLVHDCMFRHAVASRRNEPNAAKHEADAFDRLHRLIVGQMEIKPVQPSRNVLEDQIVWARTPVRLDLAGGWTDTPPYCLEHGGRVVNVAVDINGQPSIQVFGRFCEKPEIVLRSVDLGVDERIKTYDGIRRWNQLGSGFGIARAALALAGMEPRFHSKGTAGSLAKQLVKEFGGGIELSMVCAIPKGSGLGTSSILAATLLATLAEMFGLRWNSDDLFVRTLALEQMLTSGGGWQDQAGGVLGGLKLLETLPGMLQKPVARWLPGLFFSDDYANKTVLLYYTGLTRVAHDILGEIVRGMFLNSAQHLNVVEEIGFNALFAADAIQRGDWEGLCEAVRRSWRLNQRLDSGTNPPQVQQILDSTRDHVAAAKLLGAGGGGYMLILAKDVEAGRRIKEILRRNPPNKRARFVDLSLSEKGLQVTRS